MEDVSFDERENARLIPSPIQSVEIEERITRKKVFVVALLLAVNLLNFMDRFTIAGVLGRLQDYFYMNDKEAGMLQTVFIVFFMVFAPICGYLGDRYNRKMIMIVGLAIWITAVTLSTFIGREVCGILVFSKVFGLIYREHIYYSLRHDNHVRCVKSCA
ncbi:hypothetical protein Y032_0310g2089 [Ancylostoma ceylanicum]|uniref:Major facilitator superfamily (MFS) profile domain-containing protein n=1 Tax=Ancylostoma ceylanicum TaxID=53326 RepID=A0A016S2L2_9BILA|nr:hypothetical protein Y032_0310g2089 [Ancylostoma ceylanicum]